MPLTTRGFGRWFSARFWTSASACRFSAALLALNSEKLTGLLGGDGGGAGGENMDARNPADVGLLPEVGVRAAVFARTPRGTPRGGGRAPCALPSDSSTSSAKRRAVQHMFAARPSGGRGGRGEFLDEASERERPAIRPAHSTLSRFHETTENLQRIIAFDS